MNPGNTQILTTEELKVAHQRLVLIAAILTDSALANTLGSTTAAGAFLTKSGYNFPADAIGSYNAQGEFEPSQMFSEIIGRMGNPSVKNTIIALAVKAEQEDYDGAGPHRYSVNALIARI